MPIMSQSTPIIDHISAVIKLKKFDDSEAFINNLASVICESAGLTIVKRVDHRFSPIGYTLVCILSESHLAIHTWPEYNTIHIDLVSCKKIMQDAFDNIVQNTCKPLEIIEYTSVLHKV